MRKVFTICFLLFVVNTFSQTVSEQDPATRNSFPPKDSAGNDTTVDNRPRNAYGDLLNDDPVYNPRSPWTIVAFRVATTNVFSWALSRYVFNYDWARISTTTWKNNLKGGWEWDDDRFGVNFIGHPHSGNNYFNIARSNGYSFWGSYPFAIGGSFMWEYFGENTKPSRNDLINTPVSGAFLGEVLYRISSNILDDRTYGRERVFREILAGLINPTRALSRFTQGKMFRHTRIEVYQKEPLNVTLSAGIHKVNDNNKFGSGKTNAIFNLQLDYGDPFEVRRRKPFDLFRLRIESRYGNDEKLLDNMLGYGLLFGKNIIKGRNATLIGIFQHFDYWNNNVFEVGSLGFGPGIISKIQFRRHSNLYSGFHIAAVPLAGNSTRFGPDTSEFRDYPFGGGIEGKIEETLNIGKWISFGFNGYYYWIWNYEGLPGKSKIGIIKPRVIINLSHTLAIGFEHHVYYDNRFINDQPALHLKRTEQKLFIQLYLEDRLRRGRYQ